MAKKVEVEIEIETNAPEAEGKVKSLKLQLREARIAFEQLQTSGKATASELAKAADKIDDVSDKIDRAKFSSGQFSDKLASLPGPLGALGGGLKTAQDSADTFGKTLTISLGIVGLLVTAFFAIKNALGKTKEGQEGLSKAMSAFNTVLAPLFAILEKVGMAILPIVTKGFEALGTVMAKVAKFFGIGDDKIKEVTASLEENNEMAKKLADDEKKRLDELKDKKDKADAVEKARLDKAKANLETNQKLKEAALAKDKAIAMQTAFNEEQKIGVEAEFAKKSYDLQIQSINDKQKLYSKDTNEYKELQAEKITAEASYITKTGELKTQLQKVVKDNGQVIIDFEIQLAKRLKEIDDDKIAKAKEAEFIRLQDKIDALTAENDLLDYDYQQDLDRLNEVKINLEKEKSIELSNLNLSEAERLKIIKKYAKEEQAIDKSITATKKAEIDARTAIQLKYADYLQQFGNLLGQVAGKSKTLAIASIIIEQGAALAKVIISTMAANAAATAAAAPFVGNPLTAIPASANLARVILMNNIQGGLSAAGIAIGAAKGIAAINSAQVPGGGGGGGATNSAGMEAPTYGGGATASIPQINTSGGANPATQISQTIQNAQQAPIKAYVVSGDITSQQQLERKANRGATFNLG